MAVENEQLEIHSERKNKNGSEYKWDIVWHMVFKLLFIHINGIYGLYLMLCVVSWKVAVTTLLMGVITSMGVTIGAHRLYSHKAMKAKLPVRYVINILMAGAMQNNMVDWVKDHKVHHKYTDTDADPHNSSRGFFFSHMGWLLIRKHPEVRSKGKLIDVSDVIKDPAVAFQLKYFLPLSLTSGIVVPTLIMWYIFNIPLAQCYHLQMARYLLLLHATWSVNSFAHFYGYKPYDKNIRPTQNPLVAIVTGGEGWHNYHHVFPWDYRTDEWSGYFTNYNKAVIELLAATGLMYDLRMASKEMIEKRTMRTGNLQTKTGDDKNDVWGWDDSSIKPEEIKSAKILYKIT